MWQGSYGELALDQGRGGRKKGLASPSRKIAQEASSAVVRACAEEEGTQFRFSADALFSVTETAAGLARNQE